jgi:NAD(P)-dependent dehydrogenase (short-subunit alcohol dehydrogenase family)/acyl carrier protein
VAAAVAADDVQLVADGTELLAPRIVRPQQPPQPAPVELAGTVLVTGGTGGLGALVAEHLAARHGARDLLLISRRGPDAPDADRIVARLAELGARAEVVACDVSDRDALAAVLAGRRLAGVVHTAGVLADATVDKLSAGHLATVFAPKLDAACHLDELTAAQPPAMFVLFSSLAGTLGNPGQGNYAAANAALDTLAARRRAAGLPAVSVAWGMWGGESGMGAGLDDADIARLARSGVAPLEPEQGLAAFDAALAAATPLQVATRWHQGGLQSRAEGGVLPGMLRGLVRAPRSSAGSGATVAGPDLGDRLAQVPEAEGRQLVLDLVRQHVATALAHSSPDAVDTERAFSEMGFDSLAAVELRNRLDAGTGLHLPATLAFDHPTVAALATHLYAELAPAPPSPEELLRASLDQLDPASADDDVRTRLVAVAREAIARWSHRAEPSGSEPVPVRVAQASDEELFALIDR